MGESPDLAMILSEPQADFALRRFLPAWHGVELPDVPATEQVPALLGSLLAAEGYVTSNQTG